MAMTEDSWTVEESIPPRLRDEIAELSKLSTPNKHLYIFLHIIKRLKEQKRTGWLHFDVPDPESIADHMYRMGIISMLTKNPEVDTSKCVKMALVHDMAESVVGDITPDDPVSKEEKHRRELETITYLRAVLTPFNKDAADEIYTLWNEYENVSTPEARFVKDVDKFELIVQTFEEEKRLNGTKDLSIFITTRSQIKTTEVAEWADGILEQRKKYWQGLGKNI